jgi:hypothetical protein
VALVSVCVLTVLIRIRNATPLQMALAVLLALPPLLLSATWGARGKEGRIVWQKRGFFGVVRVDEKGEPGTNDHAYALMHGIIVHGVQYLAPELKSSAGTYYSQNSGLGRALQALRALHPERGLRIGVMGQGAGTLAARGKAGDTVRFYEIDPLVVELALGAQGYFTYVRDSAAAVETVLGDARSSLAEEMRTLGSQQFDLLVADAFSGDSVPNHLLTQEAFELYRAHLRAGGLLAVHVSNRHLNLKPVVAHQAAKWGWSGVVVQTANRGADYATVWVVLAADASAWQHPAFVDPGAQVRPLSTVKERVAWSDDLNSILPLLAWTRSNDAAAR